MDTLTQETLLAWIERDRKDRGWTYDELARELQVPVREIYRWKKGTAISQSNLFRIMAVLGWKIERPAPTPTEPVREVAASSRMGGRAGIRYSALMPSDQRVSVRSRASKSANRAKSASAAA